MLRFGRLRIRRIQKLIINTCLSDDYTLQLNRESERTEYYSVMITELGIREPSITELSITKMIITEHKVTEEAGKR